jgi:FkbM family methyltransferase
MISYAQNFEDVMLWRALKHVSQGCYIDIGAWDPVHDSVSMTFYEQGWRGVHVEPVEIYAKKLREARPDEIVIQAAVGNSDKAANFFLCEVTGLSTINPDIAGQHMKNGFSATPIEVPMRTLESILTEVEGREIHWLKIDVEGMEESVIQSWNKSPARPWVVVVESTIPCTQIEVSAGKGELINRGYIPAYFDGINRFYVHDSRSELLTFFRFGPNIFDRFVHFNSVRNPQDPEHQNLTNLVQQPEIRLFEPSAQIGATKNVIEECIVQAVQNASQIQDSVVAPSSYLVPGPFSWYSYLYKMLHIKKLTIPHENITPGAAYKGLGFWRRLERSIRKRRKRLFGRIGAHM